MSNARHMAAKKNNIARNAGIAAVATAALAGSVAPANAFAVADTSASASTSSYAPSLTSYDAASYTTAGAQAQTTTAQTAGVSAQSTSTKDFTGNLSGLRAGIVSDALAGQGGAYVWGGESFKAWDCSGFVSYVLAQNGINVDSYTYTMKDQLTPTSNPQPGDVVFTNGYAHVGIYLGNGKMISALNPAQGTQITAVDGGGFMPVDGYYTAR
ncbi:C40 family peptidase [Rothia sp. LK2588]|uniref:C40 family peptidase n=1 Tax=Rothia sp. LK2588 TaxID=3114369 RepID=UPI0034CF9244